MKRFVCCAALMLMLCSSSFAKSGTLYVFETETEGGYLFGYKDKKGKVVLEPVYSLVYTDEFDKIAFVVNEEHKLVGINKKGETVIVPFIFDNGPDYIEEGLFRFVENEKMGFADKDGKIVIPAVYDFVSAFNGGIAWYSIGGHREYIPPQDEHWVWSGGEETGYINKKMQKFKEAEELIDNKRTAVTFDGNLVTLNKNGKVVKKKKADALTAFFVKDGENVLWGYENAKGEKIIPAQYFRVNSRIMDKTAAVLKYEDGKYSWLCIDRNNNVLFEPFLADSEPDQVFEGFFRFVENGKIGFSDTDGNIIVPAQFDYVTHFENGKARYFIGGHKEPAEAAGDHWIWKNADETGFIDRKGNRIKNKK